MKPAKPTPNNNPVQQTRTKQLWLIRFSAMGDVILISPMIRELKKIFPNAELTLVTAHEFAEIHQYNPAIEKIVAIDRNKNIFSLIKFLISTFWHQAQTIEYLFDLHGSLRSRLVAAVFASVLLIQGQKNPFRCKRVNKKSSIRKQMVTKKKFPDTALDQKKIALALLKDFLPKKTANQEVVSLKTEVFVPQTIQTHINKIAPTNPKKPRLAIAPGASYPLKRWPKDRYAQLITQLLPDWEICLLGGKKEDTTFANHFDHLKVKNFFGQWSLLENAAFLQSCRLLVTNDSGLLHLSEAVGTPVIAMFGPTIEAFGFQPYLPNSRSLSCQLFCRPCSLHGQGPCTNKVHQDCMKQISLPSVYQAIQNFAKKK